ARGTSTTAVSTGLNLSRQVQGSTTSLNLRQDGTSGIGSFSSLSSSLTHNQQFGGGLSGNFGADFISSSSGGAGATSLVNRQLNSRLELKDHQSLYDLTLAANDSSVLSPSQGRTPAGLQRQPELTLQTDTYR